MITTENQKIKLVADIALINKDKVLLVKYKDSNKYDHQKGWFLPDDLVRFNELPEDAARRILSEQAGYITANLTLGFMESFVGNDGSWHLVFHYYQIIDALPKMLPSGDVDSYQWFESYKMPDAKEVAHHGWALDTVEQIFSKFK
ncbi:MAG: NUDIX hydrolase [Ignavibacteria bacterium]|nr:NUDIX hydrolase [Ignavibacteria bacterium]